MYAVALSYLVIVGFASVIPQVFWPPSDESFDVDCADGLRMLYADVNDVRLEYLTSNVIDPTALRDRLEVWDLRLNALRGRCDESKVELLNKYRHRVELNVQRYMREDAPLANRVQRILGPVHEHPE